MTAPATPASAPIVLHYAPQSRAGRVRWLLEELGVPYQLARETLYAPSPALLARNPLGKVPVLIDGDVAMIESSAMLIYLADRHAAHGLAPAAGDPRRAAYLQWIVYVPATLEPPVIDAFFARDDAAVVAARKAVFERAAAPVDAALADGRPHLLGDDFTAADVAVGSTLGWARAFGWLDGFPRLVEYGRRVGGRPAAKRARAD